MVANSHSIQVEQLVLLVPHFEMEYDYFQLSYQTYVSNREIKHVLRRTKNRSMQVRIYLPATGGISANGCDGAECHDLKCARVVV